MMRLPKDVSKKYRLINWKGGHRQWFGHRFGWVDVKNMTIQHADRLFQLGFSKLVLRSVKAGDEEAESEENEVAKASAPPEVKKDCGCGKK